MSSSNDYPHAARRCLNLARSVLIHIYKTVDISMKLILKKNFGNLFLSLQKLLLSPQFHDVKVEEILVLNKNFSDLEKPKKKDSRIDIPKTGPSPMPSISKCVMESPIFEGGTNDEKSEKIQEALFGKSILESVKEEESDGEEELVISTRVRKSESQRSLSPKWKWELRHTMEKLHEEWTEENLSTNLSLSRSLTGGVIYDIKRRKSPQLKSMMLDSPKKKKKPKTQFRHSPSPGMLDAKKLRQLQDREARPLPFRICIVEDISALFSGDERLKYQLVGSIGIERVEGGVSTASGGGGGIESISDRVVSSHEEGQEDEDEGVSFALKLSRSPLVSEYKLNPHFCTQMCEKGESEGESDVFECSLSAGVWKERDRVVLLKYRLSSSPIPIKFVCQSRVERNRFDLSVEYRCHPKFASGMDMQSVVNVKRQVVKERHKPVELGTFDGQKLLWRVGPEELGEREDNSVVLLSQFMFEGKEEEEEEEEEEGIGFVAVKFEAKGLVFSRLKVLNESRFVGKTETKVKSGKFQINLK